MAGPAAGPLTSNSVWLMTHGAWMAFCEASGFIDERRQGWGAQDMHNVFIAAKFVEGQQQGYSVLVQSPAIAAAGVAQGASAAAGSDAMQRHKFYEGIVRVAFSRFLNTGMVKVRMESCLTIDVAFHTVSHAHVHDDLSIVSMPWYSIICLFFRMHRRLCGS